MKFHKLSPILWIKNLPETVSFFETVLGFRSRSHFPGFASLWRDDVEIMVIVPTNEDECDKEDFFPRPILTGSLFIYMRDVDEYWSLVKDNVTIKTSLADREYGMRDFSILDNNGYEIVFGEDISNG